MNWIRVAAIEISTFALGSLFVARGCPIPAAGQSFHWRSGRSPCTLMGEASIRHTTTEGINVENFQFKVILVYYFTNACIN